LPGVPTEPGVPELMLEQPGDDLWLLLDEKAITWGDRAAVGGLGVTPQLKLLRPTAVGAEPVELPLRADSGGSCLRFGGITAGMECRASFIGPTAGSPSFTDAKLDAAK